MLEKIKFWKKKDSSKLRERIENVKKGEIPYHVAIIMDGNGRWAKKRNLPRVAGHKQGMQVVRKISRIAGELGIKALTLYAFSTENWKRPKSEVDFLMKLPQDYLDEYLPELVDGNVQVRMMGSKDNLPKHTQDALEKAISATKNNDGLILNFALNYGSRAEILEAIKQILKDSRKGLLKEEDLNEELFGQYLMSKDLPEPDLLIRTSGEIRLSNFMLWQLAYTEFWFTDVLWPDFDEFSFLEAIEEYQKRQRRFGGV